MNRKKFLALVLATMLVLSLIAGCASDPAPVESGSADPVSQAPVSSAPTDEKVKIGFAVFAFDDTYVTYLQKGAQKYADEHPDIDLTFMDGKKDVSNQLSQVENLCTQGVDAIVLQAVDSSTGKTFLSKCNEANIPLIGCDRPYDGYKEGAGYSGSSAYDQGVAQAEYVAKALNGKGNVAVMQGTLGEPNQVDRCKGYTDVFKKYPDIHIVIENTGKWDRAEGMKLMENWMQMNLDINAVCANNDEMALGAANVVDSQGLTGKILVTGIDGSVDALNAVLDGKMAATVYNDPQGQAYNAIDIAYKTVKGEKMTEEQQFNWLKPIAVEKTNAADILKLY